MLTSRHFLHVLSDAFTPVRDTSGRLLGCIPRVSATAEAVVGSDGTRMELHHAVQVCVMCDTARHNPHTLAGFVPVDASNTDIAEPAGGADAEGEDVA